jgi:RNA 3'-terminal phosphate cyclase-like protein
MEHECPTTRSIGYFLEPMLALAPWGKHALQLTLRGITNDNVDVTVDAIRTVLLPNLKRFGVGEEKDVELKIVKRGAPPLGGGEVVFSCPNVRQLKPVRFVDEGRIKRIRGLTYAARLSPQMANRAADTARGKLTRYIPDVYVYTDVYKGLESGKSPGYGLTLIAESTTGALLSAECCHDPPKTQETVNLGKRKRGMGIDKDLLAQLGADVDEGPEMVKEKSQFQFATPEDLAQHTVKLLLSEIEQGGCIDSISQWLVVLMMMLCPEDVSKVRVGKLTNFT